MIADELRRQADVFTDLAELQSKLSRDPSDARPAASCVIRRRSSCIERRRAADNDIA